MPETTRATSGALASALARVGDRWTLLVVEALMEGPQRFGEIQAAVAGIATNVLASRLRELDRQGLIVARPYSDRPLRLDYELSASGAELANVLRVLAAWGSSFSAEPSPVGSGGTAKSSDRAEMPAHVACGTPLEVRYWCPICQQVVEDEDEVWA
jgi:DNA-binding HxlR family transcriptional regulator